MYARVYSLTRHDFFQEVPAIMTSMSFPQLRSSFYSSSLGTSLTLKSMYPFLSMSNVLKTWSQNSSAFPDGKNILYISTNLAGVKRPFGQSLCRLWWIEVAGNMRKKERKRNYLNENWIVWPENVDSRKASNQSGEALKCGTPLDLSCWTINISIACLSSENCFQFMALNLIDGHKKAPEKVSSWQKKGHAKGCGTFREWKKLGKKSKVEEISFTKQSM